MRGDPSCGKETKSIPYTPNKSFVINGALINKENESQDAYINYYPPNAKRSHTPLLYRKPKTLKEQKEVSKSFMNCHTSDTKPKKHAMQKEQTKAKKIGAPSTTNENTKTSLYKPNRMIRTKPRNNTADENMLKTVKGPVKQEGKRDKCTVKKEPYSGTSLKDRQIN